MTRRDTTVSLRQMLDYAREAQLFSSGRSRGDLEDDRMFSLAVTKLVEIIGEAANRVPPDDRMKYSSIEWGSIIGMRNRLAHGYDVLDFDVIWETVTVNIPSLIESLQESLAEEE